MLRIGGAALLLAASLLLAVTLSRGEEKKLRRSEGLVLLVRHIREEVRCFRRPLPEIYDSFSHAALEECGFLSVLRREGLAHALKEMADALTVSNEEKRALLAFARAVGNGQTEGQIRLCDYTLAELEKMLAKRREEAPRRTRVLQTMSISGGLMLLVLLL